MKYLVIVVVLLLSTLLTACSTSTPSTQTIPDQTSTAQFSGNSVEIDLLEEFMDDVNNHQVSQALNLFSASAYLTEASEIGLNTTLPTKGNSYTFTGKALIEEWLNTKVAANLQIAPVDYQTIDNPLIMDALFYYSDQIQNVRILAQTEDHKLSHLYLFIGQINPFS